MAARKQGFEVQSTADEVLLLNASRYAELEAGASDSRTRLSPSDPELSQEASQFLFWEARLLDNRNYREWIKLLAPDVIYWVPSDPDGGNPMATGAVNFDDRRRLLDRVTLMETGVLHAQIPPSRTCRLIGNVEAWHGARGEMLIRSNIAIWEYRRSKFTSYAGWQEHELVGNASDRRVRKKVVNLLNCDEPQGNITFIL
jgi:3-phenylpropionate/cinnamic acid dioxygenase small subunit